MPNITDASFSDISFNFQSRDSGMGGFNFNPDGTKLFIVGNFNDKVYEFNLSSAFSITDVSFVQDFSIGDQASLPVDLTFNNSGSNMYIAGSTSDNIVYQYNLPNAFSLTDASYHDISFNVSVQETYVNCVDFNNDGSNMYILGYNSDKIHEYSLSIPFQVNTATYQAVSNNININNENNPYTFRFNSEGTKAYVIGDDNNSVYEYRLSTAFDITTMIYDTSLNLNIPNANIDNPENLAFNNDGTKMFIVDYSTDTIYEYTFPSSIGNFNGRFVSSQAPNTNICFPAGTPVLTDQGKVSIEKLNASYTIRGKTIVGISQTINTDDCLVSIEKGSLYKNVPSEDTLISANHGIMYQGKMVPARKLLGKVDGVNKVPYNGNVLYNVLMEKQDKMVVNNMIVETLNPKNVLARLYNGSMNERQKEEYIKAYNAYHKENKTFETNKLKR